MEKQIIVDFKESEEMNILAFNALSEAESAPDHKKVKAKREANRIIEQALSLEKKLEESNKIADGLKMHKKYYEEVTEDLR
jgi:hypothetical protein